MCLVQHLSLPNTRPIVCVNHRAIYIALWRQHIITLVQVLPENVDTNCAKLRIGLQLVPFAELKEVADGRQQ